MRGWCAARAALHRSQRASLARHAMPAAGRARERCRAGAWRVMVAEIWTRRTARTARLERAPVWRSNGVWEGGGPRESRAAPRVWTGGASGGVSGRQRQIRGAASANTCNNLHAPCRADPRARSEHLEAAREAVCRGAAARGCSVSKRRSRRRRGGGRARGIGEKIWRRAGRGPGRRSWLENASRGRRVGPRRASARKVSTLSHAVGWVGKGPRSGRQKTRPCARGAR